MLDAQRDFPSDALGGKGEWEDGTLDSAMVIGGRGGILSLQNFFILAGRDDPLV